MNIEEKIEIMKKEINQLKVIQIMTMAEMLIETGIIDSRSVKDAQNFDNYTTYDKVKKFTFILKDRLFPNN